MTAAACLAVVLVMALPTGTPERPTRPVTGVNPAVTADSLSELSELVGFPVSEPEVLPFEVEEKIYRAVSGSTAEIEFYGDERSAVYRQSAGQTEPLPPPAGAASEEHLEFNGVEITLWGSASGEYTIGLWQTGSFSCLLRLSRGCSSQFWQTILSGIQ